MEDRIFPETVTWACDNCSFLESMENEGTLINAGSQTALFLKKKKKQPKQLRFVSNPCQVGQLLTFPEATHSVELYASVSP